jgi:hypothetical protein
MVPLKLYWNPQREDNFSTATAQGQSDAESAGYAVVRAENYISQSPVGIDINLHSDLPNVRVRNIGSAECVVSFSAGAGHESHNLDPGERRQYARQWAGFRLYVKNEGDQEDAHRLEVTV